MFWYKEKTLPTLFATIMSENSITPNIHHNYGTQSSRCKNYYYQKIILPTVKTSVVIFTICFRVHSTAIFPNTIIITLCVHSIGYEFIGHGEIQ